MIFFFQPCGNVLFSIGKHHSRVDDINEVHVLEIIQFNACMDRQIAIKKWKDFFIQNLSDADLLLNNPQNYMRYEVLM